MSENPKQLHKDLAARIRQQGPISVAEYMERAVAAYYASRDPFGVKGDFTTAPEISQMFGEMIGAWLIDLWMQMGRPAQVHLVELGPGRGTLAADIMRTISAWADFKAAVSLHLVETSPLLQEKQATALKKYHPVWHDRFSDVPEGICFVIANEFFDALPIQQFEKIGGEWKERLIGFDEEKNAFYFASTCHPDRARSATRDLDCGNQTDPSSAQRSASLGMTNSQIRETSPLSLAIVEEISERIAKQSGAALIIDYGHDQSGMGDTLQAVSKHQYSNPLETPGEKDITAHVDFSALKAAAEKTVTVAGPVTQGQFLIALGIEARAQKLEENAPSRQRQDIMAALLRLIAPMEMGRLFKVMAFTPKKAIIVPAGFGDQHDEVSHN